MRINQDVDFFDLDSICRLLTKNMFIMRLLLIVYIINLQPNDTLRLQVINNIFFVTV